MLDGRERRQLCSNVSSRRKAYGGFARDLGPSNPLNRRKNFWLMELWRQKSLWGWRVPGEYKLLVQGGCLARATRVGSTLRKSCRARQQAGVRRRRYPTPHNIGYYVSHES